MTTEEGQVLNFSGESMSAALASQYILTFLYLKKHSLRCLGEDRLIRESILYDMMQRSPSPSYPPAINTASNFGFLDNDNRYIPAFLVFSRNLVKVGPDALPMLLHVSDVGTDWKHDGPELFKLLQQEMKSGPRFSMPEPLHELCLQYACNSPDILARLLVESKLQGWMYPLKLVHWVDINPNRVSYPLMVRAIAERSFEARP